MPDIREVQLKLDGERSVRARIALPEEGSIKLSEVGIILAHGAGSNMDSPLEAFLLRSLSSAGFSVMCFNFPCVDSGTKRPDRQPTLEKCFESAVQYFQEHLGDDQLKHLVIGGKSMGGRIATHVAANGVRVGGLVCLSYPLHPAGQPEKLRDSHLYDLECPLLFVSGTRDALARKDLMDTVTERLEARARLHYVAEADHSFKVPKKAERSQDLVFLEISDTVSSWVKQNIL